MCQSFHESPDSCRWALGAHAALVLSSWHCMLSVTRISEPSSLSFALSAAAPADDCTQGRHA